MNKLKFLLVLNYISMFFSIKFFVETDSFIPFITFLAFVIIGFRLFTEFHKLKN